ncbi:MAG: DUF1553 domain-containing protein, partial [Bacteroidota bacterium]
MKERIIFLPNVFGIILLVCFVGCAERKVDFNAEVRPILNKNCIACHGGVKQSGGFGMVFRANALGKTKNEKFGIVPGDPSASEMIVRINHSDPEMRMPLDKEPLTPEEIDILTRWIAQGAEWEEHWAYQAPQEPLIPKGDSWTFNTIDQFTLAAMHEQGLSPSPEADPSDLVRRLFLDITGLPPTPEQALAFAEDESDNKYEVLVDQLLASPQFGEHWATMWLDLARYADSRGYEKDSERQIWRYRDWVINALNADMPFDQFTIEQLAGDLLPDPTLDQLIATGFHRNTLTNDEGGTDNEEYRIAAVIDRVNTTWEVWQGTTMGCAQCHGHPYDPITHAEYFESFAFFNSTADWDAPNDHPVLRDFQPEDSIKLAGIKQWLTTRADAQVAKRWERMIRIREPMIRPDQFSSYENVEYHNRGDQNFMILQNGSTLTIKDVDLTDVDRIYLSYGKRNEHQPRVVLRLNSADGRIIGQQVIKKKTGWSGLQTVPIPIERQTGIVDLHFSVETSVPGRVMTIDGFLPGPKLPGPADQQYAQKYAEIDELLTANPAVATPVMVERDQARLTNVFIRGNWLVPGDTVEPSIPDLLGGGSQWANRLDLARWLVSPENPLTSRVIVNRIWAQLFGRGIVATPEDFGTLGDAPSHPAMLDWLALEFSGDLNWSLKQLIRELVLSATYRQSARIDEERLEKDPANVWLARGPRTRLSAEQVRDQALAVSGLLSDKMYGPSVMPPQPEGVWSVVYSNLKWVTSEGENAYRRGLYTYLRRSSPYPSFVTFDASEREVCVSRRINTNTPLQALVTMNDPVYLAAAQSLAQELATLAPDKTNRAHHAYLSIMSKKCSEDKAVALSKLLE